MRTILPSREDQRPLAASVLLRRRVINTTRPAVTVSVTSSSSTRLDSVKPTNGRVTAHLSVSIVIGFDTNKTPRTFISDMLVKSQPRLQLGRHAGPQLHQSRTMSLAQHVTQSEGFDYVEQAGDGPPSHGDDERADETTALLSTHRPPNRKWRYMKFGLGHQAEPERQVAAY
ncbi:hypothetical protein E4U54_002435 [Claviceps lovelessii]|nr:hypothetical protein E4U54_002435 [Claviceps lovelessii]